MSRHTARAAAAESLSRSVARSSRHAQRRRWQGACLASGLLLVCAGCATPYDFARTHPLDGVRVAAFDGWGAYLEQDPTSDMRMLRDGSPAKSVTLHPQDAFWLSDGARHSEEYQLLIAEADQLVFRVREHRAKEAGVPGWRTRSEVIRVEPYDLTVLDTMPPEQHEPIFLGEPGDPEAVDFDPQPMAPTGGWRVVR